MDREAQENAYKQEIEPLLHQLREAALRYKLPYLAAIQVDDQIRIWGDLTGANHHMREAFSLLLSEE